MLSSGWTHIDSAFLLHLLALLDFGQGTFVDVHHVREGKEKPEVLLHHIQSRQHVVSRLAVGSEMIDFN